MCVCMMMILHFQGPMNSQGTSTSVALTSQFGWRHQGLGFLGRLAEGNHPKQHKFTMKKRLFNDA